jgi:hypothetical protein
VECATALGERIARHSAEKSERLRFGFQLAVGRNPNKAEVARLGRFWTGLQEQFKTDDRNTCTAYARVLLNLDETITRE